MVCTWAVCARCCLIIFSPKQHGGDFVLRIEDTDQSRYVDGAEEYIMDCLKWCGLIPDESPAAGGHFAPYRQSERKAIYREYAESLVMQGHAYYAFDTPEELDKTAKRYPIFNTGRLTAIVCATRYR